jgi:hypothetical protein
VKAKNAKIEKYRFQAETKRLLDLMIHSLYTTSSAGSELASILRLWRLIFKTTPIDSMCFSNYKIYDDRYSKSQQMAALSQTESRRRATPFLFSLRRRKRSGVSNLAD